MERQPSICGKRAFFHAACGKIFGKLTGFPQIWGKTRWKDGENAVPGPQKCDGCAGENVESKIAPKLWKSPGKVK